MLINTLKEYGQGLKLPLGREIGLMVKRSRSLKGISQKELAIKVGTEQSSISRLENSITKLPSLSFLNDIASALDTELIPPMFEFDNKRIYKRIDEALNPSIEVDVNLNQELFTTSSTSDDNKLNRSTMAYIHFTG